MADDNKDPSATDSVETLTPENDPQLLTKKDPSCITLCSDPLFCYSLDQMVPIPSDSIENMYKETGPKEGVAAHKILEDKMGFACQTLLGELMYAYITCHPNIDYSVTTLSKFSYAPAEYHYKLLQMIAKYLQVTAHWGIQFKRSKPLPLTEKDYERGFFRTTSYNIPDDSTLKEAFNVDINTSKLMGFVDAVHANDL